MRTVKRHLPELDRNGWRLMAAKVFRGYAFGLNAVALGLYLAALQLPAETIGLILAAALAGTLALTAVIGIWGDRIGRRRHPGDRLRADAALGRDPARSAPTPCCWR